MPACPSARSTWTAAPPRTIFSCSSKATSWHRTLRRPQNTETTALGAAFLSGLASGFWKDADRLCDLRATDTVFAPRMGEGERARLLAGWARAVARTMS